MSVLAVFYNFIIGYAPFVLLTTTFLDGLTLETRGTGICLYF